MKRLFIVLATFIAGTIVAAGAATAAGDPAITLHATPASPVPGDHITLISTVVNLDDAWVDVYAVRGATCAVDPADEDYVDGGPADTPTTYTPSAAGTYAVTAYLFGPEDELSVASDCTTVTVAVPAPSDELASSYLCWNRWMVNPVAYADKVADTMWKTGNYFEPQAMLGNVAGGTNVGAYHLVCNAPDTMTSTGFGIGGSGEVYSPEMVALYHAAHAGTNDLNVYHVYK